MSIAIAPYDGQYADSIGAFISGIQRNEFQLPVTLEDQPDLARIESVYQQGNGNFWTAYDGDDLIGTIALLDAGDGIGILRKMFVHRDYRGQSGLAQRLLEELTDWALAHDFTDIYLGTRDELQAARKFYLKNGYKQIAETSLPDAVQCVKMPVDNAYYHKDLRS